jgi:hypothetical protein
LKFTTSLFVNEKETVLAYDKKLRDKQKDGKVCNEWSGVIDKKKVKLWLPQDTRQQYKLVLEAEAFMQIQYETSVDKVFALKMSLWEKAKEHMLVEKSLIDKVKGAIMGEGCQMTDNDFAVEFIEQVITVYVSELLLPLYHGSCTAVRATLINTLKPYISESSDESGQLPT